MPFLKNNSARVIHVDGMIGPGETAEVSQERVDSKPVQDLLDSNELQEEAPPKQKPTPQPAATPEQQQAKK